MQRKTLCTTVLYPFQTPNHHLKINPSERIWLYYLEKTGRSPRLNKFTALRREKGLSRQRECLKKTAGDLSRAEELMKVAIDNLTTSAWHMGGNPSQRKYDSWEKNLFKSEEQLEEWLNQVSEVAS